MKNNRKGFTLVELLIVIAIIGILASIVLVSLNGARERAQRASAIATLASAMGELTVCADDLGEAKEGVPAAGDPVCCDDDGNTCSAALAGHSGVTWPDISGTGFEYDDPTGALSAGDYVYGATSSVTGEQIVCSFATHACQGS